MFRFNSHHSSTLKLPKTGFFKNQKQKHFCSGISHLRLPSDLCHSSCCFTLILHDSILFCLPAWLEQWKAPPWSSNLQGHRCTSAVCKPFVSFWFPETLAQQKHQKNLQLQSFLGIVGHFSHRLFWQFPPAFFNFTEFRVNRSHIDVHQIRSAMATGCGAHHAVVAVVSSEIRNEKILWIPY